MSEYVEDRDAWPTMVSLAACVQQALEDRMLPGVCRCAPVPGPLAIMDSCGSCSDTALPGRKACGGQGWVRLQTEFPSSNFPQPDTSGASCQSPVASTFEVGIARCLPVGKGNAITGITVPTTEELVEATRLQMADKAAIKAAINCCLTDLDLTYTIGQYQPLQITGDCGGGFWLVTVWSV